jgi:hypothetical protein
MAQEEVIKKNTLLIIGAFFCAFILHFAYTIPVLAKAGRFSPFPYDPQVLSWAAYIDYGCKIIAWIVVLTTLCQVLPAYREVLFIIDVFFVGYFIEYILIYNNPIGWITIKVIWTISIPIGYSTFAGLCFILMFVIRYLKE